MIQVGGESNGEQQGNSDHESLQSTTPAVASLLQATQASGDLLSQPRIPQVRSVATSSEASAHQAAPTVSVVTTSGMSLSGSASYQHYLSPAVSIGGHIHNITIPAQVSVTSPGVAVAAASPPQNLARMLAAATQQGYGSPSAPSGTKGLLSSMASRLAATNSPAALLATTQPPGQQQAIVMDTLQEDSAHAYNLPSARTQQQLPPSATHRAPAAPPQSEFAVPKRTSVPTAVPSSSSSLGVGGGGIAATVGGGMPTVVPLRGVESPRAAKRLKLEERPPANEEVAALRQRVYDHRYRDLQRNKECYVEHLTELFFLQNGGNMMDYFSWKRRPTPQLVAMLRAHALDSEDEEDPLQLLDTRPPAVASTLVATTTSAAPATTTPPVMATAPTVAGQPSAPPGDLFSVDNYCNNQQDQMLQ